MGIENEPSPSGSFPLPTKHNLSYKICLSPPRPTSPLSGTASSGCLMLPKAPTRSFSQDLNPVKTSLEDSSLTPSLLSTRRQLPRLLSPSLKDTSLMIIHWWEEDSYVLSLHFGSLVKLFGTHFWNGRRFWDGRDFCLDYGVDHHHHPCFSEFRLT